MKEIKKIIQSLEKILEFRKTPKGKMIFFFGFYLIFFIVIAILSRVLDNDIENSSYQSVENHIDPNYISIATKNGNNYAYQYSIQIDDEYYNIDGTKNKDKELFSYTYNNQIVQYYKQEFVYYQKQNNNWIQTIIPNINLAMIDNFDKILKEANYNYKTEYENGKVVLNYQVKNNIIRNYLNMELSDTEENLNDIYIVMNNDRIDSVEWNLTSYCIESKKCLDSMNITMNYRNFGLEKEIVNPIN